MTVLLIEADCPHCNSTYHYKHEAGKNGYKLICRKCGKKFKVDIHEGDQENGCSNRL